MHYKQQYDMQSLLPIYKVPELSENNILKQYINNNINILPMANCITIVELVNLDTLLDSPIKVH